MSSPPVGCTTPACQEKVILNGDTISALISLLCARLEELKMMSAGPNIGPIITVFNAMENLTCLANALYLDAVEYHGTEGRGLMLQFSPHEKELMMKLAKELNIQRKY